MATLTINVRDETLHRFRQTVETKMGSDKGTLGKAIDQALTIWISQQQQKDIANRQKSWMEKGFHLGKVGKWDREEIHDRKY